MDMAGLANLSGASTLDIQNWLKRLSLTTRYAKTTQGKAQKFNRDNAVEISLIARLVRTGMAPAMAAERVRLLFKQWELNQPLGWVVFFCEEKDSALGVLCEDEPPTAKTLDLLDEHNSIYVLMNAARLVDRVDAYFAPDEEEAAQ